ncbi:conserved hypothetical protein [Anaeromyxobacter dehalogenans 2CP-1]|uniref:Lipoprotein n=1 Tax=Anaeromyxobacter dehalogenans (strain ATCC BAA-258 / DSM 21875 / 2CP-1) TaxID=455488 RepID=B8J6C0_ANAD2|nr:conserved hypothetical protein [Anaeromyxobacter dehalogenans 2CP-1]
MGSRSMRTRFGSVAGAAALAAAVAGCGGQAPEDEAAASAAARAASEGQALAAARAASARYHDVAVAEAEGFAPLSPCVASPAGAMGIHYINLARLLDPSIEADAPEALLYLPTADGLALVGVEYVLPIFHDGAPWIGSTPPDAADVPPRPSLFGQAFQGPMEGHGPGEPWHYDLHVWIWRNNPAGTFAQWNPALSCP